MSLLKLWGFSLKQNLKNPKPQETHGKKEEFLPKVITMFRCLKGGYKEDGDSLLARSHMEKMRGDGDRLLLGRFRLDTRGKFFTQRTTTSHGNCLPREVVDPPTSDAFTGCWAVLSRLCFC